jgi:hypothetical protein
MQHNVVGITKVHNFIINLAGDHKFFMIIPEMSFGFTDTMTNERPTCQGSLLIV